MPKHPLLQARYRVQKRQRRKASQASPASFQAAGTATGAGRTEAGRFPSLTPCPSKRSPLVGKGSQEMVLPEGLTLELAPRLTPSLAASSSFPNRSQVWARCPGRK